MADAKYKVEALTVEELLSQDSVSFAVPKFQRNYAWKGEEIEQLLDDLYDEEFWLGEKSGDTPYFLGSLVLAKDNDASLILDGQQRLATISLLLAILKQKLEECNFKEAIKIERYLVSGKIGQKQSPKIKLQTNDSEIYVKLVNDPQKYNVPEFKGSILAQAVRKIYDNLNNYAERIVGHRISPTEVYQGMLHKLLYNVEFVSITSPSENDAFKLFETLNDRGLALNAADLIKNKLFAQCAQQDMDDVISAWGNIVETVGENEIVHFLRYFWIASKDFVRKRRLYDVYRKHFDGLSGQDVGLFALQIEEAAQKYQDIANPNPKNCPWGRDVGETLQRLVQYRARSCRPALLACAIFRRDVSDMKYLVLACESITVRYSIVGEKNPNQLEALYADLCKTIRDNPGRSVKELLSNNDLFKDIPNDKEFAALFTNAQVNSVTTGWREILIKLNMMLSTGETKVESANKVHIEHILPQKPSAKVLNEAGLITTVEANELIYKIGNLTLLLGRKNRENSNRPFSQKKPNFESSEIVLNRIVAKAIKWGKDEIEDRSKTLADLAIKAFPWPII